jgi:hypothetical protein
VGTVFVFSASCDAHYKRNKREKKALPASGGRAASRERVQKRLFGSSRSGMLSGTRCGSFPSFERMKSRAAQMLSQNTRPSLGLMMVPLPNGFWHSSHSKGSGVLINGTVTCNLPTQQPRRD